MGITLGAIALPDGLRWEDEHAWSPVVQRTEYSLTGALLVERAERRAGRPVTLVGGRRYAWLPRSALQTLHAALASGATTIHCVRTSLPGGRIPRPRSTGAWPSSSRGISCVFAATASTCT